MNRLQFIDFASNYDSGIAQLRERINELDSPKGIPADYKHRLADAERDLHQAQEEDQPRIPSEIEQLKKPIEIQQKIVDFVAPSMKLIIELDGSQHRKQKEYDEAQSAFLKSKGYRVAAFGMMMC